MDTWEYHFREKSRRRATAWSFRSVLGWSVTALAFLAFVTGVVRVIGL